MGKLKAIQTMQIVKQGAHAAILALYLMTNPALAGEGVSSSNAASAEALFEEAKALMESKEYDRACAAFRTSQELDPAAGTLLNLGKCYEEGGQTARAWATFKEARDFAARVGQTERADLAQAEADRLQASVPKVTITLEGVTDDTLVLLDGEELTHGALGVALALDPGLHVIEAIRPGYDSQRQEFTVDAVAPGATMVPGAVSLGPLVATAAPVPAPVEEVEPQKEEAPAAALEEVPEAGGWSGWQWGGLATAGAGLIGAGVGVGLGFKAVSDADKADCSGADHLCTPGGLEDRESAQDLLQTSYIVGIAGGVVALGGAAFFVFGPQKSGGEVALHLGHPLAGLGGVNLKGSF